MSQRCSRRFVAFMKSTGRTIALIGGSSIHAEVLVFRSCANLAIFVLIAASPAFAQYVPVIQACSRDVPRFCAPHPSGSGPLVECIKAHFQDFSEPCKAAHVRIPAVLKSCGAISRGSAQMSI